MAVTETDRREQNKAMILIALPILGLVAGLFLAGLMSVVRRFKLFS
jgi:hypothetical protein